MREIAILVACAAAVMGHARRLLYRSEGGAKSTRATNPAQALGVMLSLENSSEALLFNPSSRGLELNSFTGYRRGTLSRGALRHTSPCLQRGRSQQLRREEEKLMRGHGLVMPPPKRPPMSPFSKQPSDPDLANLIDEWKEELAIADDGETPLDQEKMMDVWRKLIDKRERELFKSKSGGLRHHSFVPAHLTSWDDTVPENLESYDDRSFDNESCTKLLDSDWESESEAQWANSLTASPRRMVLEQMAKRLQAKQDAEDEQELESMRERDAEDADSADDAFTQEWQLHAEQARAEAAASIEPSGPPEPLSLRKRWGLFGRGDKKEEADEEETVGIDLGTTNSAIAVIRDGKPVLIPLPDGKRILPSIVSFLPVGSEPATSWKGVDARPPLFDEQSLVRVVIGEEARRLYRTNRWSTYSSTKRLIGRTATAEELKQLMALDMPCKLYPEQRGMVLACPALGQHIEPFNVASEIVRELCIQAENSIGRPIRKAVVTVPAYFDEVQRMETETACILAGIETVRLLREPEAAALTFALECQKATRVMVFDLGGGTFDVSILDVGNGVIEVVASSGDPRLGGNDWDTALATWLADQFFELHGVKLDAVAYRRVLDAAEKAKVALSTEKQTQVELPRLVRHMGMNVTLTRRKFEALCRSLLLRLVPPMREVVEMAGLELDETRMGTLVKGYIKNTAPRIQKWRQKVAWRWRRLAQKRGLGTTFSQNRLGVPINEVLLVGGGTRMPSIGRFIKRMTGLTVKPSVNPDEAVALGAAVQAGILDGRINQKLFNPYQHDRVMDKVGDSIGLVQKVH